MAWFFAEDRALALWGLAGRYNGLLMLLACTVLYFVVRLVGGGVPLGVVRAVAGGRGLRRHAVELAELFHGRSAGRLLQLSARQGRAISGHGGQHQFYGALLDICLPIAAWELLTAPDRDNRPAVGHGVRLPGHRADCGGQRRRLARGRLRGVGALHGTACHGGRLARLLFAEGPGRSAPLRRVCWPAGCPSAPNGAPCPGLSHSCSPRWRWQGCFCAGRTAAPLAHGPQLASRAGAGCPDRFTGG